MTEYENLKDEISKAYLLPKNMLFGSEIIPTEDLSFEQSFPNYVEISFKKNSVDDNYCNDLYKKIGDEKRITKIENEDSNTYRFYGGLLKRNGNHFIYELEID